MAILRRSEISIWQSTACVRSSIRSTKANAIKYWTYTQNITVTTTKYKPANATNLWERSSNRQVCWSTSKMWQRRQKKLWELLGDKIICWFMCTDVWNMELWWWGKMQNRLRGVFRGAGNMWRNWAVRCWDLGWIRGWWPTTNKQKMRKKLYKPTNWQQSGHSKIWKRHTSSTKLN